VFLEKIGIKVATLPEQKKYEEFAIKNKVDIGKDSNFGTQGDARQV
jgi:hypothetical protein